MIIGTAGHIDHGKTALVKALTGIDTDRLPEEKRRGITLELGFAHLALENGVTVGVVDVPGHERFVKAMAAGAGGIDVAVFVVAADEGVMPQTREHLDICRLLGVRAGVVAITKADLLDGLGVDWLELLHADIATLAAGTFLEDAPRVACSARTGAGLDALTRAISAVVRGLAERPADGPAFLPIDRAFSIKGFGTVVTGTLLSGHLAADDQVSLLPGRPGPFRVRGLQVHGAAVEKVAAGERTAVNLVGVETEEVSRGMVLARHQELPESRMLDVELTVLPAAEHPLPRRSRQRLHLGTAQVEAIVALLDLDALAPGETGLAQLRLGTPVAALPDQRFILRGAHPLPGRGATLAGGRVLTLSPPRRRRGAAALLQPLVDAGPEARLPWLLRQAGYRGLTARELFARSGLSTKALGRALDALGTKGAALLLDKERRLYLSAEVFQGLQARALAQLQAFHAREPLKDALSTEELRQRLFPELEPKLLARLVQTLTADGRAEATPQGLRLAGRGRALSLDEQGARTRLVAELSAAGLAPPSVEELAQRLALPPARVGELLKVAVEERQVARVAEGLYFEQRALEALRVRLVAHLQAEREISTQAFKELVGQSRKFVIPLSEFFDRERVTLRVGEKRVLRKG